MKYAKLTGGRPEYAPRRIVAGDEQIFNPTLEHLSPLGYKPVTETPQPGETPAEGFVWTETWTETDEALVRGWTQTAAPEEVG